MRLVTGVAAAAIAALGGLALPAGAQQADGTKTILVLDASGSMWGQIEGRAKITIAQEVVAGLLADMPGDRALGLTAYGHRRKGDCGDIETLVPPAPGTADEVLAAVMAIKPKGKTPLSAAVLAAAEVLKYTEEPATVVLVSDGRETCDLDPCEVGRRLEETGVGFTAHVVGFDVADEADRAQLRCLAESTGGRFLTASNAAELAEALDEVSVAPPPPPAPEPEPALTDMVFIATDGEGGPQVRRGLVWTLTGDDGELMVETMEIPDLRMALSPGGYRVEVLRLDDEQTVARAVTVAEGAPQTVELPLEDLTPPARVEGPAEAVAGSTVQVAWEGPEQKNDFIAVARADQQGGQSVNSVWVREGNPAALLMPPEPGEYELRYVLYDGREVLARQPITVTEVAAALEAPAEAVAGSTVQVGWEGPDYQNDFISVAKPDQQGGQSVNSVWTRNGEPAALVMPAEPGEYEIRYVQYQDRTVLARQPVTVTEVTASVTAPSEAPAGANVPVEWTGPDYPNDFIAVVEPGEPGGAHASYVYTREGSPLALAMPPEPGEYEIRYVQYQDRTVLARQPVTVTEVTATLEAPAEVEAGSTILVAWAGPGYPRDFVSVARPDDPGGRYEGYTYAREGSPLRLTVPEEPGAYEIRYVQGAGNRVLARRALVVADAVATLETAATAKPGTRLRVDWTGPGGPSDLIAVARPTDPDGTRAAYARADRSPLMVELPDEPGEWEVRYLLNGSRAIARHPVTLEVP
ncbi:MAG TPA: VWA domain-containing protein [Thermohalobaculum sp.]|nr:VWA domain-containing protein [Thermohalobaculum sp.]